MKRYLGIITIIIMMITMSVKVRASYEEEWLAKKKAEQEKYMKELEADGNLTEEAYKSITKKDAKNKKRNEKNTQQENKGLVYGVDELHVTGLPTDERGYTQAGNYGEID